MKKLGIIILGLFLLIGCATIAVEKVEKIKRQASNVPYTLLDLGECREEPNGFTFCNIAEAINPISGHILQWIDTDYMQKEGLDGKCDIAVLFMSQTDGLYHVVQDDLSCEQATEQILEADKLEDHYKESELFKGESLLKKD